MKMGSRNLSLTAFFLAAPPLATQAHLEFFSTSFEDEGAGNFSIGTAPLTATFSGGQAQQIGIGAYYRTGTHSWHVPDGGTSVITFETPADFVDFYLRDTAGADASTYRVYDTSDILLAEGSGTQEFVYFSVSRSGGNSRIARVEFDSAGGGDTVVDDFSFAANEIPISTNVTISLEEPTANRVHGGIGNLRGWAVSPDGISHVEIFINGTLAFEAPYGGNRPDVAAQFPDVIGSLSSGFSLAYGYSNLLPGEHTITARAHSLLGQQSDATATFTVVGFEKTFIGPSAVVNASNATITPDGDEISVENISIDGRVYDIVMKWRTSEQGFEIIEIR